MEPTHPAVAGLLQTFDPKAAADLDDAALAVRCRELREELGRAGAAARPGLRRLLDGPPMSVREAVGRPGVVFGAKLLAVAALEAVGTGEDIPRLERLAGREDEPLPVRLHAAAAWMRLCDDDIAPDLAHLLLHRFPVDEHTAGELLAPFEDLRRDLVRPLAGHLYHRDMVLRARARVLLITIGEPAIERLKDIVRTSEDDFARNDAAAALERIEPEALRAALIEREADLARLAAAPGRSNR